MNNRLYLDIHVLQTVPPSCINRDDTGSPKTAIYGGVTRARVSSQSWKKAVRDMFTDIGVEKGVRTKRICDMVAKEIGGENAFEKAEKILTATGITLKDDKKGDKVEKSLAGALFFISTAQAKALAKIANEGYEEKKDKNKLKDALNSEPSIDIALFGRMVADDTDLNIDASCQVAHAISTHKVANEYDYFTAIDEHMPEGTTHAGAGMLGTVEYNSSTLYRYATVAVHDLNKQLGENPEITAMAVSDFIRAFVLSMPTGKQNTFANQTPPYAVYVALRNDQPANFVGAFEKPIKEKDGSGYAEKSAEELTNYAKNDVYGNWLSEPEKAYSVGKIQLGENVNFNTLLENIRIDVNKELGV